MIKHNCHTHSVYCDGKDTIEDMIISALEYGMKSIGISSHGPLPFETNWTMSNNKLENYLEEMNNLKKKYEGKIDVLTGLEMDYLPNIGLDYVDSCIFDKLDYYIGSVHYLGELHNGYKWCVDETVEVLQKGIADNFNGSTKKAIKAYYSSIADLAKRYEPPVIGHLDLIKKNNKCSILFNENDYWYREIVEDCLNTISKTNCIIEINTGGIARGYTKDFYPSKWILDLVKEKHIPITINSDAHSINAINYEFNQVYNVIKEIGFKYFVYLTCDGYKEEKIV